MGCYNDITGIGVESDKIYQLVQEFQEESSDENLNWITMSQKLNYTRYSPVTMLISDDLTSCN